MLRDREKAVRWNYIRQKKIIALEVCIWLKMAIYSLWRIYEAMGLVLENGRWVAHLFVFWFFWWVGKKSFPFDVLSCGYFTLSPCRGMYRMRSRMKKQMKDPLEENEKRAREIVWYWKGGEGGPPITANWCLYINIYHVMLGGRMSGYSFPKDAFSTNQIARAIFMDRTWASVKVADETRSLSLWNV